MLLCRSLRSPAGPGMTTNRHRVGFPLSEIERGQHALQSQPNPLGLTALLTDGYPQNGTLQTHCTYLGFFQGSSVKGRPFFRKGQRSRCLSRPKSDGGRLRAMLASSISMARGCARKANHAPERSWNVPWNQSFARKNRRGDSPVSSKLGRAPNVTRYRPAE